MALTFVAVWLLTIPYLQVLGGILLIPIAIHLVAPGEEDPHIEASDNLWSAVKTIILADFLMSIDNILSVAGAANGDFLLVVFGLMVSIPIIVMGSQLIGKVLDRFPFLMYAGAAMIGWTSGTMFLHDKVLGPVITAAFGSWVETGLPAFLALAVCVLGYLKSHRNKISTTKGLTDSCEAFLRGKEHTTWQAFHILPYPWPMYAFHISLVSVH